MGVPTSEVGYTIATTRRETTKVPNNMWWHWEKKNISEEHTASNFMLEANCNSEDGDLKSWHPPVTPQSIKTIP